MAVGNSRRRKPQRKSIKRKLDINETVEVRSMEHGFLGSWHLGTVTQCGKLKRSVRYENLLDDNGTDHVMVEVIVPKALDGDVSGSSNSYVRGSIRPIPPLVEFEEHDLKFGMCVDVDHQDAWWEGVIFDHSDGMQERSVFFPDLGDEMKTDFHNMRITQDWDEVTGEWRRRGKWVFLELLQECERTTYIAVSAKQIWYDIRMRKDFIRIKEWTYNVKELWKDMILEVVNDYLKLTIEEIVSSLDLPNSLSKETQELDSVEPKGISSQCSTSETPPRFTNETPNNVTHVNVGMRFPKLPIRVPSNRVGFGPLPISPPCSSPTAVRPTFIRPTTVTATPSLHAPFLPPAYSAPTSTLVQPSVTATPSLHAPFLPPAYSAPTSTLVLPSSTCARSSLSLIEAVSSPTPTLVQPPSTSKGSSPPPSEIISSETTETSPAAASKFLGRMRFMPTPGLKASRKKN